MPLNPCRASGPGVDASRPLPGRARRFLPLPWRRVDPDPRSPIVWVSSREADRPPELRASSRPRVQIRRQERSIRSVPFPFRCRIASGSEALARRLGGRARGGLAELAVDLLDDVAD